MYKFLKRKKSLPSLTQEEVDNLNCPLSIKEIFMDKSLSPKKTPGPDTFLVRYAKHLRKKNKTNSIEMFLENRKKDFLLYEAIIILIPKGDKDIIRE